MKTIIFYALITCCGWRADAAQIYRFGNSGEPKDLDPQLAAGVPEYQILQNLYEPLLVLNPKTLKPEPAGATSWTSSKDGLVWTFNLRKEAKWSNGDAVTAEDYVYAWRRLLDPALASSYAYFGYFIKNAEAINAGKIGDLKQLGVRAKDAHTLELTLERPTPYLMKLLYFMSLYPVHQKTVEKFGGNWTHPENTVTNGPYIMSKWEINKVVALRKNPHYWDQANVKIEGAEIYPIDNTSTEEKMFRTGKLHHTWTVPAEKLDSWRKSKGKEFQSDPMLSVRYLFFNFGKPPMNDSRIRKALCLAIDRKQIVDFVTRGNEKPSYSFTPPGAGEFQPKKTFPTDLSRLAEAKKLIAEAGFKDGKGFPKIELVYNTNDNLKKILEAAQQMWQKHLGIHITLNNQEWKSYVAASRGHEFPMGFGRWEGDYDDPLTFLNLITSTSGSNFALHKNEKYDKLIELAEKELNNEKRYGFYQQTENIIAEDMPYCPIYVENRNYLLSPSVVGWSNNRMGIHPLKGVSLLKGD